MVWAIPFSLATTKGIEKFLSFPPATKMFQFTGFSSLTLCIHVRIPKMVSFLIRRSPDQSLLTTPRGNIAVRRVLHRLLIPRHPPYALINLTTIFLFDEF